MPHFRRALTRFICLLVVPSVLLTSLLPLQS